MKKIQFITSAISAFLLSNVACSFDPTSNSNIVYYWGQNSASVASNDPSHSLWQKPLSEYCNKEEVNILVISFLHKFGEGRSTSFDLANNGKDCLGYIPGTELLNCPNMEADIKLCQANGKKVLLSMGGATPEYGISSDEEGKKLADELWDTFGAGHGINRPFGNSSVDGFDLDIENGAKAGYPAFVKRMREHYEEDTSKEYYIAAAPQCPFPDLYLGETLDSSWIDFVMVQFYNNYCNVINGDQFNYNTWNDWAKNKSVNKNVRLFVGVPGSPSAAGRGYVPFGQLVKTIKPLQDLTSFGGVMVWDASQAYGNMLDVLPSYAHGISRLVHGHIDEDELASMIASNATIIIDSAPPSTESILPAQQSTPNTAIALPHSAQENILTNDATPVNNDAISANDDNTFDVGENVPNGDTMSVNELSGIVHGEACKENGMLKCSGETNYGQCTNGYWVVRNCPIVTVCKENNNSVYCGFS